MFCDLHHNKIVASTVTPRFVECLEEELLPLLRAEYGEALKGICMYEDHLDPAMTVQGRYYYPMTVITDTPIRRFVSWDVSKRVKLENGVPYAYVGDRPLDFSVEEDVPAQVLSTVGDGRIYYSRSAVKISVHSESNDPLFLKGRYSQSFVDELAEQITDRICRLMSVEGIENTDIELSLVFAGDTYMEHTSENTTYRRLLLSDKSCQPRDLWVKWTRSGGSNALTVADRVKPGEVRFELGEDVPQKIREKEFRFLCRVEPDKYQSAMGKKTATEWRDIIKRALKRGDLRRVELPREEPTPITEDKAMAELLSSIGITPTVTVNREVKPTADRDDELIRLAREALGEYESPRDIPEEEPAKSPLPPFSVLDEEPEQIDEIEEIEEIEEKPELLPEEQISPDEEKPEPAPEKVDKDEKDAKDDMAEQMARMRRELEASLRLEYEERERLTALRHKEEQERILAEANKRAEDAINAGRAELEQAKLLAMENDRIREESRMLKDRIAMSDARQNKEREMIAEAARLAVEEQRRLEADRREALKRQQELAEEQRREDEERRQRELVEQQRAKLIAEAAAAVSAREPAPATAPVAPRSAHVAEELIQKIARIQFRYDVVNLNVISKIKEIVERTLISEGKQDVKIFMKAYPQEQSLVVLDVKLPSDEQPLLVTLIKAIGNGGLGVTKITLE